MEPQVTPSRYDLGTEAKIDFAREVCNCEVSSVSCQYKAPSVQGGPQMRSKVDVEIVVNFKHIALGDEIVIFKQSAKNNSKGTASDARQGKKQRKE